MTTRYLYFSLDVLVVRANVSIPPKRKEFPMGIRSWFVVVVSCIFFLFTGLACQGPSRDEGDPADTWQADSGQPGHRPPSGGGPYTPDTYVDTGPYSPPTTPQTPTCTSVRVTSVPNPITGYDNEPVKISLNGAQFFTLNAGQSHLWEGICHQIPFRVESLYLTGAQSATLDFTIVHGGFYILRGPVEMAPSASGLVLEAEYMDWFSMVPIY
ncbi:hypothetical protein ACFL21_00525 [Patescibacteria group bacterium]